MPDVETKFINSLFLKNLIENQFNETNVKIIKFTKESASEDTNNVVRSSMNRILIRYASQESTDNILKIVAKIKPTSGDLKEEFKRCDLFDKETLVYQKIIPAMVELLKKVGGKIEIGPDLIYSSEVPSDVLIFEDLTTRGYSVADLKHGLSLDQSLLAVEKLAFFHAASVILMDNAKVDVSIFANGTFHDVHKEGLKYFTEAFRAFVENGNGIGISPATLSKLQTLSSRIIEKGIEDYTSCINGFKVLNHGDFWTGNLLFLFNKTEVVDVLFLDFQNSVIGSPIIDLIYFLTTSVSNDVLVNHRDLIVYTYHKILSALLLKFNYGGYVPTLNEIQVELLKRGALEIIYTLTAAPYLRASKSKINPAIQPALYKEELMNKNKTDYKYIFDSNKIELQAQLERFESLGLLEWGARPTKIRGLMGHFQR